MAIQIIQSFSLKAAVPLDNRTVVQNLTDIPTGMLYDGLLVYQRSNKKYYKYEDGIFSALTEALGVATFNDRAGNITVIAGDGLALQELELGRFEISANGVLRTDGSNMMDETYTPTSERHVTTKNYVDGAISDHAGIVASNTILGHVKIDNLSIKTNTESQIYVDIINGGEF